MVPFENHILHLLFSEKVKTEVTLVSSFPHCADIAIIRER